MAYTAVPQQTTGGTWTADDHNLYWRDNMEAGLPAVFGAVGDIAVGTTADTITIIPLGADGKVLIADSAQAAGVKWGPLYSSGKCRYTTDDAQSIANVTTSIVNYNSMTFDPGSLVTTGASWKFTAETSGYYIVTAMNVLAANAGWAENEAAEMWLYKNNSAEFVMGMHVCQTAASGGFAVPLNGAGVIDMAATDYIDVRLFQNSGGAIALTNDHKDNHVAISRVMPA